MKILLHILVVVCLIGGHQSFAQVPTKSTKELTLDLSKHTTVKSLPSSLTRYAVKSFDVRGSYYSSQFTVKDALTIKVGDEITNYDLKRQEKNIMSTGLYADVEMTAIRQKSGAIIRIEVTERPYIGQIIFKGNDKISTDTLRPLITSKPQTLLNAVSLREDMREINDWYHDQGYVQGRVFRVDSPQKNGDPLVFNISEGLIEDIRVTGNTKTKGYVILREMVSKKGNILHQKSLKEDIRRIYNLGYFQGIEPRFYESKVTPNVYTLELDITERASNAQFSFGGGYSPRLGFSLFTDFFWDNFLGTGQLIALKSQFGRATTYQFKYYNPWMWDERKSFTFKTWTRDGEVAAFNPLDSSDGFLNERSKGVELGIGYPHSYEIMSTHFVKYERVVLPNVNEEYDVSSYRFGLAQDTRDVRFSPLNGMYNTIFIEKGLPAFPKSLEFTRYDLTLRNFHQTYENHTIATRLTYGKIESFRINDADLFGREIYQVGGSSTIRGYEEYPSIFFGSQMALATAEYRIHFNDIFEGLLFVDAGYATYNNPFSFKKWRMGKGVGIRIQVPGLGPLRLDFGIDDEGVGRMHFNIGQVF